MPPKEVRGSSIMDTMSRALTPSSSEELLGTISAAGNRKRAADYLSDDDNSNFSSYEGGNLTQPTKRRRASVPNSLAETTPSDEENTTSPADEESGTTDVSFLSSNVLNKPDKRSKVALDINLPPVSDVREMFEDMIARINPIDLKGASIRLNVATLCSGTDAPIFALDLVRDALVTQGFGVELELNHLFSCEIEPFKQGFIRRNLPPGTLIFRDVVELASTAPTGKA